MFKLKTFLVKERVGVLKLVDAFDIYDPATGRDVNGVWTRDPFPGNIIPTGRLSANGTGIMKLYPEPTPGFLLGTANAILTLAAFAALTLSVLMSRPNLQAA